MRIGENIQCPGSMKLGGLGLIQVLAPLIRLNTFNDAFNPAAPRLIVDQLNGCLIQIKGSLNNKSIEN